MTQQRRTLSPMMDARYQRLLGYVCDVVLEQGGDWEATHAVIERELAGEDFADAEILSLTPLIAYVQPGGIAFVRGLADRYRHLVPAEEAPRRRWPWRVAG